MNKLRGTLGAAAAIATALALSACSAGDRSGMEGHHTGSSSSASPSATASDFNEQDVVFAQLMVPHHEQAIVMAETLLDKAGVDPAVAGLAEQIRAVQGPEIDTMNSWLERWGAESDGSMGHGGHGGHGGMMSEEDMTALESADGAEASQLFLEQMIEHHQGAIEMAEIEVDGGQNPDALALAEKIASDQQSEIETMQDLLATM